MQEYIFEDYDNTETNILAEQLTQILERDHVNFEDVDWAKTEVLSDGKMTRLSMKCQR